MPPDSATLVRTRRKRTKVEFAETNQALGILLEARNAENITPQGVIAPSACRLLILNGWAPGRASYILRLMVQDKILRTIEHSSKLEIIRPGVYIKDFPKFEPPQAQESQLQPEQPRPAVPTPRDLAPRFMAARENTDLAILKHRLEEVMRAAEKVGRDLEKFQEENARLQEQLTQQKDQISGADARAREVEALANARAEAAEARANEAISRALTAQAQLNSANQALVRYRTWEAKVVNWVETLPKK